VSDSNLAMNPNGGAGARHCDTQPALHVDLMEAVVAPDNMQRAWAQVKSNRGAPGCDGMPIEDFPAYARTQWTTIRQGLIDGTYQPQPVRRVMIPKPGGGERALGIPSVVDRVIQQAIAQVMTPIFDSHFSESSFGFRPKRSAHGAVKQIQSYIKAGYRIAVDLDLAKFFDNVQHDILMSRVARRLGDKRVLALIGRYLRAGVKVGERLEPSELGTPQGGPLTPWTQKRTSSLNERLHLVVL
jgi:RNA-directed DNA polymerase